MESTALMVLAVGFALPSCSRDASGPDEEKNVVLGTWVALSMAGETIPFEHSFTDPQFGDCTFAVTGMEMTFDASMHYDSELATTMQCGAFPLEAQRDSSVGTYRLQSNHIYFRGEAGLGEELPMDYVRSGTMLTLTETSADGETWVYHFRKK